MPKTSSLRSNEDHWPIGGPQDVFYRRPLAIPLPHIVRAQGIYMWDTDGRKYVDVSSGPVVSNIGHAHPAVIEVVSEQIRRLAFSYCRVSRTEENIRLSEMIAKQAGRGFERVHLSSGGSEAMDMSLKFARQFACATGQTQRTRIISCHPSYHGGTLATMAISGDEEPEETFRDMAVFSTKVAAPLTYRPPTGLTAEQNAERAANELETAILREQPEGVLAFVIEPVGGLSTGANVAPAQYYRRIRQICKKYGVLLIYDEVMAGAGRTGRFLAAHHWPDGLPDIVVLAKGIGAGYTPLGIMLVSAAMNFAIAEKGGFNFGHTYNANPLTCAIGAAVLDVVVREGLVEQAANRGRYLRRRLDELAATSRTIGDVRGIGLLQAIELVADKDYKAKLPSEFSAPDLLRRLALDDGLIIYSRRTNGGKFGDWIMITPPLTISEMEIDEIIARLGNSVRAFEAELGRRGVTLGSV